MNVIKKSLSSVVVLTTFLLTTSAFAMEAKKNFTDMPEEIKSLVVSKAAYAQCLDDNTPVTLNKTLGNLRLVCHTWCNVIDAEKTVDTPTWKAWYGVTPENENIYKQFLNGTLIYRPVPQSDEGMIQLKISDLINPLEGTFDLSGCDNAGEYLSISTGYRKGKKLENSDKLEIWLAPRFMIEKKLKSSANHLQPIMDNWEEEAAPIGILWNWGRLDNLNSYDYLTDKGAFEISSKNLYENWFCSDPSLTIDARDHAVTLQAVFMFICEPK